MANPRNPEDPNLDDDDDYYYFECDDTPPPPQGYGCEPLPSGPKAPKLPKPKTCEPKCDCPTPPSPPHTCFDKLIARQDQIASRAARASQIKADLTGLQTKANTAKQTYTRQKYQDFEKRWKKLDKEIVGAIEIVTCNIKCWWCVIECHICPELYRIRWIEERLYGGAASMSDVHSLTDLQYWHTRNVQAKQRLFERIQAVLNAWDDPATTIDAALSANEQLVGTIRTMEPVDGLQKVFFDLIPRHMAIAPRSIDNPRDIDTAIEHKYLHLCAECDPDPDPDDCCGPDVSLPSVRQRLIPPQAFIVDPDRYFDILCCLVTQRYEPAQRQLESAQAVLAAVTSDIQSLTSEHDSRVQNPFASFKTNIALPIDCHKYGGNGGGCGEEPPAERPRRTPEERER